MYNWNTNLPALRKNRKAYTLWRLNQLINFGLNGEKLNLKLVKKHWQELTLDPLRKKFLRLILWKKKS